MLRASGIEVQEVKRYDQGEQVLPNLMTLIQNDEIDLIVNTPSGEGSQHDMRSIRAAAILRNIPCITTLQGAWAAINGIQTTQQYTVRSLQEYYQANEGASCAA
jgi:carbamoyl-phosphate synthase large subunit